MASGNEIHLEDLPPELRGAGGEAGDGMDDWEASLRRWAERRLGLGDGALLDDAMPRFETVLIKCALGRSGGAARKRRSSSAGGATLSRARSGSLRWTSERVSRTHRSRIGGRRITASLQM